MDDTGERVAGFEGRERFITDNVYFCETCNLVMEAASPDLSRHKGELKHHKLKRLFVVKCFRCGKEVLDVYAEFSPERNEFWCRNCIEKSGYSQFRNND